MTMKKHLSSPRPEFVKELKQNLLKAYDAEHTHASSLENVVQKTWGNLVFWRVLGVVSFGAVALLLAFPQKLPSSIPIEKVRRTAYSYVITSDSFLEQEKIIKSLLQETKEYPELYETPIS